jgi:hypothetical protein
MATIASPCAPAPLAPCSSPEASVDGGVLLLLQAWHALPGRRLGRAGVRWQGVGGDVLLFAFVVLPLLAVGSVRAIAQRCGRDREPLWRAWNWGAVVTQRRLARFATSARHDWLGVLGAMVRLLAAHPATILGASGVLAVDSTVVAKPHGRHLPHRRRVYDTAQRRHVWGYEVVSACVAGARRWWPVGLLLHQPTDVRRRRRAAQVGELPSKLDQALSLVQLAVAAGVGAPTVVGDSAFAASWWLREIAALGRHWLVSTRHDRRLRIGTQVQPFASWVLDLPLTPLGAPERGRQLWGACLDEAVLLDRGCGLRGLACRPVYVERRDRAGRVEHRWYLVTSQRDGDLATVWQHWGWRWAVEVLHRDAKQYLHLDAFHGRRWAGLVAHVAATSLRASLLAFLRAADPACGALSTEALVGALREAAVVVQPTDAGAPHVGGPTRLPATRLWPAGGGRLPTPWCAKPRAVA